MDFLEKKLPSIQVDILQDQSHQLKSMRRKNTRASYF